MKIAQIAPLMESVPPRLYGGTNCFLSHGGTCPTGSRGDLVRERGLRHRCRAGGLRIHGIAPRRQCPRPDPLLHARKSLTFCISTSIRFHFPLFRQIADRTVTTLHGRQDLPDLKPLYLGFSDMPLVSSRCLPWTGIV
jgi:hypothetical protein